MENNLGVQVFKTTYNKPFKGKKKMNQDFEVTLKIASESSAD